MKRHEQDQNSLTATLLSKNLRGILLPFTTPFDPNGEVQAQALRSNLRKWNKTGITGYVALGSTGERVHLEEREYLQVIEAAREEVPSGPDGLAFIVGAGQQSTRGTADEIKRAAAAGADAVLVATPHYYRQAITQEVLIDYYNSVADESRVPVILYSVPDFTGIKIAPETVARLSEHENIIGIKDSSADVEGLRETVKLEGNDSAGKMPVPPARNDFAVLTGNGTVLYDALCAGACGAILAVGCVVPELYVEIFRAVQNGNNERAAGLQEKLTPLATAVTTKYGIAGLKAALDMAGYVGGSVRAPLREPSEEGRQEIRRLLNEAQEALQNLFSKITVI